MSGLGGGDNGLYGGEGLYRGYSSLWSGASALVNPYAVAATASISLSASSVAENAALSTAIGTLSVDNGTGSYTFSITSDPDNKFALSGDDLINDGTFNYEAATSHSVTIEADNGVDDPISRTFTITVTNVYEAANLSALSLDDTDIPEDASATVNITGATSGSTITLLSGSLPTGMSLNSGARTISGTPTTVGESTFTLRETLADSANSPRDTALSLTVSAAAVLTAPTLTLTSDTGRVPVTWDTSLGADIFAGDVYRLQVASDSGFSSIGQDIEHDIVGGELEEDIVEFDLSGDGYSEPTLGTHYYRARYQRDDGSYSSWSSTMTVVVYDFVPSAFSFTDQTDLTPSTLVYSNSITVAGVTSGAVCDWAVTGSGFEAQVNGTGSWATSGTCVLDDDIQLRGTTSASDDTPLNGVLDIEGVTDTWTIRTAASASAADFTVTGAPDVQHINYGSTQADFTNVQMNAGRNIIFVAGNLNNTSITVEIDGSTSGITLIDKVATGIENVFAYEVTIGANDTKDIRISGGSVLKSVGIVVGVLSNAAAGAPTVVKLSFNWRAEPISIGTMTIPADGVGIACAVNIDSASSAVWTDATEISDNSATTISLTSAKLFATANPTVGAGSGTWAYQFAGALGLIFDNA